VLARPAASPLRLGACLAWLAAAVLLAACAGPPREPAPLDRLDEAQIPGIPAAPSWGDEPPPNLEEMIAEVAEQRDRSGIGSDVTMLALSGGAEDGAFGAGLLRAWSETGTRPEFTIVTGASTGALSAPFAFLGPEYDDELETLYGGLPRSASCAAAR